MKDTKILFLLLFISNISSQFLRKLETNNYDYSSYQATSTNENLSSATKQSTSSNQSVVYITKSGVTIDKSTLQKSGDSSNIEDSEFYGVNAAVLVQGGSVTITDGIISTSAKGGNAVCATNSGKVTISGTKITSTGPSSARGLHSTYGGSIIATNVEISSTGGSCATLATDRGEGTVSCTGCTLNTEGAGSPLIYSTGDITVSGTSGIATGAQMVVIEGKNTATVKDSSNLKCYGIANRNDVDKCGVMLYQSMSGDAATGTSTFNCANSNLEILEASSVYISAPMFFITNTNAVINLESCTFTYGSNIFLSAKGTSEWGNSGSNGGSVTLSLNNQEISGNFEVDGNSELTIKLVNSQINGTINSAKTASKLAIIMDSSSKIILTGNSYYTSIENADSTGSNIEKNNYSFSNYEGNSDDSNNASTDDSNNSNTDDSDEESDDDEVNKFTGSTYINVHIILMLFILF